MLWCATALATPLVTVDYPGAVGTRLTDINNAGEVVGTYFGGSGSGTFVMNGGVFTPLAYPGALTTVALGLSNAGAVAGWYLDDSATQHGFLWEDGVYTNFDPKGATSSYLSDVNSHGDVVGGYCAGSECHGFLTGNGLEVLDVPGADATAPNSINDSGFVVGDSDHSGFGIGFVRNPNGTLITIEFHDPAGPVGLTAPSGINSYNVVVGWAGFKFHGFLWRDGVLTNFNVAEINLPSGVNDRGQIAGTYQDANGEHGFITQTDAATPEPAGAGLAAAGLAAIFVAGRRRRACYR